MPHPGDVLSSALSVYGSRALKGRLPPSAVVESDVFGGMGSWNDVPLYDDPEYRSVSDRLFRELQPSLLAAVNSGT